MQKEKIAAEVALQESNRVVLAAGIKVARHKNGGFQEHGRAPELGEQLALHAEVAYIFGVFSAGQWEESSRLY